MNILSNIPKYLKNLAIVLLSIIFAINVFSLTSFFSTDEKIIYTIDTAFYSTVFNIIFDILSHLINKCRLLVSFTFSDKKTGFSSIKLENLTEFKRVNLKIEIKGKYLFCPKFEICEPNGIMMQIHNKPDFINISGDDKTYEIDISKMVKQNKSTHNLNRTVELDVILETEQQDFSDEIVVEKKWKWYSWKRLFIGFKSNPIKIVT